MTLPLALSSGVAEALASLPLPALTAALTDALTASHPAGASLAGEAPAPDQWSRRIPLTIAVLGFALSMCWLMLTGWRRRAARQEVDLPTLPPVPAKLSRPVLEPIRAYYVGTTTAGAWLDRIAARGLDARGDAVVTLSDEGLLVRREAVETASPIFIPAGKLRGARTDRALAGKVVGADGMLIVTWTHGGSDLDTGLIADDRSLGPVYVEAIERLVARADAERQAKPYSPNVAPAATDPATDPAAETVVVQASETAEEPGAPAAAADAQADVGPASETAVGPDVGADVPSVAEPSVAEPDAEAESEPELYWGEDVPVDEPEAADAPSEAAETVQLAASPSFLPAAPPTAPPTEPASGSRPIAAPALVGLARPPALLVLEDGRVFRGEAYGARGETFGEAVFNTGMTGYQETLTDPSYHRQVVVMTAPHVGNTGVNDDDPESSRIWVAGYVVRDPARVASSWRSQRSLSDELAAAGVVGISGVDTRALTRHLRERGAMRVGVSSEVDGTEGDVAALLDRVRASPGMAGADLAGEVTTPKPYVVPATAERRFRVAALDLGIKRSTPRYLAAAGCDVVVLPAHATAEELLALRPDGVFVSNGPGDPATADGPVAALRGVLDAGTPVFGICFGNQVLGRALGLGTYKLVYGHRGVNQPVQDRATGRVAITSHNHGFAVDADPTGPVDTPYGRVEVSHVDLNDGVVEGLRCLDVPAFSVQYHPEAAPGPHDANGLFASFADLMESRRTPEVAADGPPDAPRSPSHDPEV